MNMKEDFYYHWLKRAKVKISALQKGEVFELKSLFDVLEWNTLEKNKSAFGRYFARKVREGEINNVEEMPPRKGPARYKKIK